LKEHILRDLIPLRRRLSQDYVKSATKRGTLNSKNATSTAVKPEPVDRFLGYTGKLKIEIRKGNHPNPPFPISSSPYYPLAATA
jgi:hypothetical protein